MYLHRTGLIRHLPVILFIIIGGCIYVRAQRQSGYARPKLITGIHARLHPPAFIPTLLPNPFRDESAGGSFKTYRGFTATPVHAVQATTAQSVPPPSSAQQKKAAFSLSQIKKMIPNAPDEAIAKEIRERGVNFKLTLETIDELKILGAQPLTIELLKSFIVNRPPSVTINSSAASIEHGDSVVLSGNAYDLDDDELDYSWSASQGRLIGDGAIARLETSTVAVDAEAVEVKITLTVTDRKGGSSQAAQVLSIRPREEIKVWQDGSYLLIQFNSKSKGFSSLTGSIEITVELSDGVFDEVDISGDLPGVPCNIEFKPYDNISEYSLKERPRAGNDYRSVIVQILPKDNKRTIRFALNWRVIKM